MLAEAVWYNSNTFLLYNETLAFSLFFFSCIVFVPVDVIKNLMQLQRRNGTQTIAYPGREYYHSSSDALFKIIRSEGMYGLYKGYGATLLSFGPFSSIYFLLYEEVIYLYQFIFTYIYYIFLLNDCF